MLTWRELRFRGFWHVCLTGLSALFVIASAASFMSGTVNAVQLPSSPAAVTAAALPPQRAYDISAGHASQKAALHKLAEQELASVLHRVHMLHVTHVKAVELRAKQAKLAREHAAWVAAHPPAKPHVTTADAVTQDTAPVIRSGPLTTAAVESLWENAGGPAWAAPRAAEIAYCESGYNPRAWNPSGASGIWQILGSVVPGNIFDPYVNALNAVAKFKAAGDTFSAWVCQ